MLKHHIGEAQSSPNSHPPISLLVNRYLALIFLGWIPRIGAAGAPTVTESQVDAPLRLECARPDYFGQEEMSPGTLPARRRKLSKGPMTPMASPFGP